MKMIVVNDVGYKLRVETVLHKEQKQYFLQFEQLFPTANKPEWHRCMSVMLTRGQLFNLGDALVGASYENTAVEEDVK